MDLNNRDLIIIGDKKIASKVIFWFHGYGSNNWEFKFDANGAILLLPGSRVGAVNRIFPLLLEAFAIARSTSRDQLRAIVIYPSTRILRTLQHILSRYPDLESVV